MASKNGKAKWYGYISVRVDRRDGYGHVMVTPIYQNPENGKPWNPSENWDTPENLRPLADMEIHCQFDLAAEGIRGGWEPYGWQVQFSPLSVRLDTAERIVKVLRKAKRGLAKLSAEWGEPANYGQYVQRVLKVLGASGAVVQLSGNGHTYSENTYSWREMAKVPSSVEWELADAKDKHMSK